MASKCLYPSGVESRIEPVSDGVKGDRRPHAIYFDKPTLTVQSFALESDINHIVARALSGHSISNVNSRVARFGDFSNIPSYQDALDLVKRANGLFDAMPSKVRNRFDNDASKMIAFLQDDRNRAEAIDLGLLVKPVGEVVAPGATAPGGADTPKA